MITLSFIILSWNMFSSPMLLNMEWSLSTMAWRAEMLFLVTGPCCRDA